MGIKRVIIPEKNLVDIEELDAEVKTALTFIPCKTVDKVLKEILFAKKEKKEVANSFEEKVKYMHTNEKVHNTITAKNKDY